MKILIYGAGAVGGYLGARLAQHGHTLTLVTREITAEAINNGGLFLTEDGETIRTQPVALTSITQAFTGIEPANYDLIVMTMKSYDLHSALDHLVAFCPEPPPIIAIQNGIGVEQQLVKQYGAERIIAGSLTTPISKETTNRLVVERVDRGLGLAPTQAGQNIKKWVSLFEVAGIPTEYVADYRSMKWSKALLNIVGNASSAILNRSPGAIYKIDPLFELEIRMLREAIDVMDKMKIKVIDLPGSPATKLATAVKRAPKLILKPFLTQMVAKGRGDKMPSFHIDLMAGKGQTEVIYHNGAIARAGEKVGVPTPVNIALTSVLLKLTQNEVDWRDYDGNAKRLLQDVHHAEKAMKRK
ncbi:MAG: ketopantoate reductase family protein [Anaerolineales bacterium]|nr:ketopantoate reductase family protein [Anaerolineales bacterium]